MPGIGGNGIPGKLKAIPGISRSTNGSVKFGNLILGIPGIGGIGNPGRSSETPGMSKSIDGRDRLGSFIDGIPGIGGNGIPGRSRLQLTVLRPLLQPLVERLDQRQFQSGALLANTNQAGFLSCECFRLTRDHHPALILKRRHQCLL